MTPAAMIERVQWALVRIAVLYVTIVVDAWLVVVALAAAFYHVATRRRQGVR